MVVTRFAPSPTGDLHIGGARTALYAWLYARRHGGRFVLRIEDTDRERSTPKAVQAIFDGLGWLGLESDVEAEFQSRRLARYGEVAEALRSASHAYYCYCTRDELTEMREAQKARKQKPRYDGRCRGRTGPRDGVEPVLRFRNPVDGQTVVPDLIRGDVTFDNAELDDLIILRSDGSPTYNFCLVVDDHDMGITHVIRGDDHVNNTPRQINILRALGAELPAYAHVPMILGADGVKLSKRHGAVSVIEYRSLGLLPDAVLNYLARLGWSHGDQEVFTRDELVEAFDLGAVQKSPARFDMDKLVWINHETLKRADVASVVPEFRWHLERIGVPAGDDAALAAVIEAQRERCKTLVEMSGKSRFFFEDVTHYNEKDARKHLTAEGAERLDALAGTLDALAEWTAPAIHDAIHALAGTLDVGLGKLAQPARVAVAGMAVSPPIDQTLALLGRERTLSRLRAAAAHARESAGAGA